MRSFASPLVAAIAAIAALLLAAPAGAAESEGYDLHDARYCEILEVKTLPPDGKVIVWNTIGLNDCPQGWWDGFDAAELAAELGSPFVVLNGPRHFLMESAKARTGEIKRFHGKRMRRVATLPVPTIADLAQIPYAERTVDRLNTWHWNEGRTVYELLAPDGSTYLMQAYSQIVDPTLKKGDLKSLGERLALPRGWEYRARKLDEPLTLRAAGSATILQDELKNTYQRLPAEKKKKKTRRISLTGITKTVGVPGPGQVQDQGTITGKPFGAGTVDLIATFGPNATMTGEFTIENARGSAFGTVSTTYVFADGKIVFDGTAVIEGGTGRYRGIRGKGLVLHDENTLDGQNGRVTLTGEVRF